MRCGLLLFIFLFIVGCELSQKNNSSAENSLAVVEESAVEEENIIINDPPPSTVSGFGCVKKTDYDRDPSMFGQAQTYFSGVLFSYLNIYECQESAQEYSNEQNPKPNTELDYTVAQETE
jgi:hypothetical protein